MHKDWYDTDLTYVDEELHDPSTASSNMPEGGTIATDLLRNGNQLECVSCHDVHNKYNHQRLLVMDDTNAELCITCHDK